MQEASIVANVALRFLYGLHGLIDPLITGVRDSMSVWVTGVGQYIVDDVLFVRASA